MTLFFCGEIYQYTVFDDKGNSVECVGSFFSEEDAIEEAKATAQHLDSE